MITKNNSLLAPYLKLSQGGKVAAEYVWLDACGVPRSKTTTCNGPIKSLADLKEWNFDGSSTGQAPGENSDIYLRPVAYFPDPFRGGDNVLVLAECYNNDGTPNKANFRHNAVKIFEQCKDCLLYTSPSPRDGLLSRMPSSA